MRALIVEDGTQRGALAAVRSLGRAGYEVAVASPQKGHAARSRYCARWHAIPAPVEPTGVFAGAVSDLVARHGYEVAFGVGDAEAIALSEHRDVIGCELGYPDHDVVRSSFDKVWVAEAAERAGIAVPRQVEGDPVFPVLVKERIHGPETATATSMRVFATRADDAAELADALGAIEERGGVPVVEEFVTGPLEALVVFAHEGSVRAISHQVADKVYPPGAGVSVRATTIAVDDALALKVDDLIADMGWSGVAEMQFLRPPDGEARLIDFNGRFYGSLALAIAAGVDLPVLWARAISGDPPVKQIRARAGVRYQWLEGDLRRAVRQRGETGIMDVLRTLAVAPRATHSIWGASDPWPAVRFAAVLVGRALRKAVTWRSRTPSTP